MPPEKIIEKAKKLLEKTEANGCTKAEAFAAAEKLQELLDKHNISLAGLTQKQLKSTAEFFEVPYPGTRKNKIFIDLAATVAYGYGAKIVVRKKDIEFIGVGSSAIVAVEMFHYLWKVLNKIASDKARSEGRKGAQIKSFKNSFIRSASSEIFSRFYDHLHSSNSDESFALIKGDTLDDVVNERYPGNSTYDLSMDVKDEDGARHGRELGKKISLNEQIDTDYLDPERIESEKETKVDDDMASEKIEINKMSDSEKIDVNRKLIDAIVDSGLSIYKIEKLFNITNHSVRDFLSGEKKPSFDLTIKLAHFFQLDVDEVAISWALKELALKKDKLDALETADKFIEYKHSNDVCEKCEEDFISFVTVEPEWGEKYQVSCPKCGEVTPALTGKLNKNKEKNPLSVRAKIIEAE